MKTLTQFIQTPIAESLTFDQKKLVDQWKKNSDVSPQLASDVNKVYKGSDTIIHPFHPNATTVGEIHPEVKEHLEKNGYTIGGFENYRAGYAVDTHNRQVSIGKALTKTKAPEHIKKAFENDPSRNSSTSSNLCIAYTHDPYHVAGASTDRGWTSCMNMSTGTNAAYLQNDIASGTHAAYLIHANDKDIESPIARISLKPHVSDKGHTILRPETNVYGTAPQSFHEAVTSFAHTHFPSIPGHVYKKDPNVYDDDETTKTTSHRDAIKKINDIVSTPDSGKVPSINLSGEDYHHVLKHVLENYKDSPKAPHILSKFTTMHIQPKTGEYIADTIQANPDHKLNDGLSRLVLGNKHTAGNVSDKAARHLAEYISSDKAATHMIGTRNIVNHPGLTDAHRDALYKKNPSDTVSGINPKYATDTMVADLLKSPKPNFHATNVIGSSKISRDQLIDLAHRNDDVASAMSFQEHAIKNPNYDIQAARQIDLRKRGYDEDEDATFALHHPQGTVDDLEKFRNSSYIDPQEHLSHIRSAAIHSKLYQENPEKSLGRKHEFTIFPRSKYSNELAAANHTLDRYDDTTYGTYKTLAEFNPDKASNPFAKSRIKDRQKEAIRYVGRGGLTRKLGQSMIDSTINGSDLEHAKHVFNNFASAYPVKQEHFDQMKNRLKQVSEFDADMLQNKADTGEIKISKIKD